MPIYKQTTEITNIDDLLSSVERDIEEVYFGDKNVFTVWGEYDGTLPAQYSANGSVLADYRIYGSAGGVGDRTVNLFDGTITPGVWADETMTDVLQPQSELYVSLCLDLPIGTYTFIFENNVTILRKIVDGVYAQVTARDLKTYTITTSSNTKFGITAMLSSNENWGNTWIMLTSGSTAPAEYVPYGYEVDMVTKSGNLFDKETFVSTATKQRCTASSTQTGFSLTATGNDPYIGTVYGVGASVPSQYRPALVKVMPNTKYTLSASRLKNGYISYIDNSFTSISFTQITTDITSITVTTPANTSYLFFRFGKADAQSGDVINIDNVVVNRGESASYQPYSKTVTPIYIDSDPLGEDEYVDYGEGKIYRRFPNIFDIASITSVKRMNVETSNGLSNTDNVITFTLTVGGNGAYSYNSELTFEPNVEYQLDFDIYLAGTSTSNYIAIALTNTAVTALISNEYFNYEVSKDSWVHVNVSLIPTESAGMLRIQARFIEDYIQLKNVVLRKSGFQPIDPPVPLPALPTVDGTNIVDYAGQSAAPTEFYAKYRKEGY